MKSYKLTKLDWLLLFSLFATSVVLLLAVKALIPDTFNWFMTLIPITIAFAMLLAIRRHDRLADYQARQNDYRQMEAWVALQPFVRPQVPFSGLRQGALSPDMAEILCREILMGKPELAIECGAGVSTIITGYLFKRLGSGRLVTLEHDPLWAERVTSWVKMHNLEAYVTVLHAPLVEHQLENGKANWYDLSEFQSLMLSIEQPKLTVDLLFVDGPPEFINPYIRRPALSILQRWLSSSCVILVDDADRPAEVEIVQEWLKELGHSGNYEQYPTEKGTVIIRLNS